MEIDQVIGLLDHFLGDDIRRAFGLGALRIAGIEPVHVLVVGRVHVRRDLFERGHVHERDQDERARHVGRLDLVDEQLDRDDRRVLRPVRTRNDGQHRSRVRAVHRDNGMSYPHRLQQAL